MVCKFSFQNEPQHDNITKIWPRLRVSPSKRAGQVQCTKIAGEKIGKLGWFPSFVRTVHDGTYLLLIVPQSSPSKTLPRTAPEGIYMALHRGIFGARFALLRFFAFEFFGSSCYDHPLVTAVFLYLLIHGVKVEGSGSGFRFRIIIRLNSELIKPNFSWIL